MPKNEAFYIIVADFTLGAGTERAVTNLANDLADHENKVTVISCHSKSGLPYFSVRDSVQVVHLGIEKNTDAVNRGLQIMRGALNYVKGRGGFIMGTHTGVNNLLPVIARLRGLRSVACEHVAFDAGFTTRFNYVLRVVAYRFVDLVVVLTDADRLMYEKVGIPATVIPNKLPFSPDLPKNDRKKRLLSIGRLTHQKGFDLLIPAVAPILKKHPEWEMVIIGEGELKDKISKAIANLGLASQISLVQPTKNIKEYYQESSLYLMSSRFEGLPMVLLEAQASGLPIITFDCPTGPREVVSDGYDGFVVPLHNQKEFTNRIELMIESPNLRHLFGMNAFYSSQRFSGSKVYHLWESALESIK